MGREKRGRQEDGDLKKKTFPPSSHKLDLGASLKNPPPPSACLRIAESILSTIGRAALNCCLIPPGQSSRSVAPTRGSDSSTRRRAPSPPAGASLRGWVSLHAATQAAAAWSAWSPGPIGRRMETGLLGGRPDAAAAEGEEEVEAATRGRSVVASSCRRSRRVAGALRPPARLEGVVALRGGPL